MSMSSHAAGTPVASSSHPYFGQNRNNQINTSLEVNVEQSSLVASSSKCCKRPTACPPPTAHIDDRTSKRQRNASPSIEPSDTLNTFQSGSPTGEASSMTMYRRPPSTTRDMSPPVDPMIPPINSADCCLGIVACDEQGEIVGWTS